MSKKYKAIDSQPDFPKLEQEILDFWNKEKIFEKSLEQTKDGEPFTFYDGPPFATGLPHYGHILASTIKDVIPRYQTMKGRYVRRRWGWDCHGLPIEELVEKELGISGKKDIEEKVGIKKFNETCRKFVLKYAEEWGKTVERIARWTEFDNSYKTMDTDYMESVWWAFKETYDKDLVYEGRKVLLYCPRCETPISNFEVAMDNSYKDITDQAVTVKFKIQNSKFKNTYLLAWTTTPWTLPGNLALAVGSDIMYEKVKAKNQSGYYIVAKALLKSLFPEGYETVEKMKGSQLVGLEYEPLFDVPEMQAENAYKIYAADFVNTEDGTGIVHTAVVYGEDDYQLGLQEGLPVVPLLDEKGVFNELSPELIQGQRFKESEKAIIKDLDSRGLLFKKDSYTHSYPHCWRCENPLFYNAIPAWFINIQKIKKKLIKSNDKEISWYPEHLKHGRYEKSVEQAPDWNISRNRYWGNPIPVWKCEDCEKNTVIGSIVDLGEKAVSGYKEGMDLHRPYIDDVVVRCDSCGKDAKRISEIFDSWVEAGSMPFASVHWPFAQNQKSNPKNQKSGDRFAVDHSEFVYPAQFVSEYIAQTRAWFYVMHVVNLIQFKKTPFENVLTTGTILADDGSKMSKSKKNFPDPWEVMEKYGVDSLRFYLMNSVVMQAENLNFSERDLGVSSRKVVRILWNVLNYLVTYSETKDESKTPKASQLLDEWMEGRNQELVMSVTEYFDNYDTVRATRVIEAYINDLSTWYVRRSRGRSDAKFFEVLYDSLTTVAKVIAPVMPYIAEMIYLTLNMDQSVHLEKWPEVKKLSKSQQNLLDQMQKLRETVVEVHAMRAKASMKLRQPLASVTIVKESLEKSFQEILREEVNVKEVLEGDAVELATKLTPELTQEGLAAELQRQINQFRKESGMKIGEMAELQYDTKSKTLAEAIKLVDNEKVYASKITEGKANADHETELEVEGENVRFYLKVISNR